VQKAEHELASASDPVDALLHGNTDLAQIIAASVGELLSLDVVPESLHRIEIGRVAWKENYLKPSGLDGQPLLHCSTLVCRQAVPDEDRLLSSEVSLEMHDECLEAIDVVVVGLGLEVKATPLAIPSIGDASA